MEQWEERWEYLQLSKHRLNVISCFLFYSCLAFDTKSIDVIFFQSWKSTNLPEMLQ